MDLTKASKKYHEYCKADKHQSGNNKEEIHVSYNHTPCNPFQKVQMCYLEELVTGEEVSGRLQDSSHGFSQLLVHGSGGGGRVWLSLEYKLCQTHEEKSISPNPTYE